MKVVCAHCALPFSVARAPAGRAVYCCSGCAFAARLSSGAEAAESPPGAPLVAAAGAGFVFFNQILLWLLAVLLAREPDGAGRAAALAWTSLGAGAVLLAALGWAQAAAGARRAIDGAVWLGAALLLVCAAVNTSPATALAGNAALAAWALRGLAPRGSRLPSATRRRS
ncbi:MAG: hypothetical protein MUE42_09935 [Opitutaceae bacterium]|nr:hypothetical protein [Opitutaceae bacterium]